MSDEAPYKAVIFDLDDTLYPYMQYAQSGISSVQRYLDAVYGIDNCQLPPQTPGEDWEAMLEHLCRKQLNSMDNRLAVRLKHVFLTHIPRLQMFREAHTAIACLRQMNIKISAFAPGPAHAQRMKSRALGIENLLDMIIYPDDLLGHDTVADSLRILSMTMETPLEHMIIAGNMGLTDFRPLTELPATLLAVEHSRHNPNSHHLLQRGDLICIKSLIEIPNYASGTRSLPENRCGENHEQQ